MQGYGYIEQDLAFETAIHVGTHLICWGSRVAGWGTQEQIEDVVRIGRDLVVRGWEKDTAFFEGTVLRCLFTRWCLMPVEVLPMNNEDGCYQSTS